MSLQTLSDAELLWIQSIRYQPISRPLTGGVLDAFRKGLSGLSGLSEPDDLGEEIRKILAGDGGQNSSNDSTTRGGKQEVSKEQLESINHFRDTFAENQTRYVLRSMNDDSRWKEELFTLYSELWPKLVNKAWPDLKLNLNLGEANDEDEDEQEEEEEYEEEEGAEEGNGQDASIDEGSHE